MTREELGNLLRGLPLPCLAVGQDERIIAANAHALALLGEGIEDRHFTMAMRQPGIVGGIEAALREGEAGHARHTIPGASFDTVHRVTITPVNLTETGRVALCAFEDQSEQEQIGQMRRDFVANVSHELRTPLTALIGFIETLRGPARDDPGARERFLGTMEREANRMNRLVSDLLSLSRVESQERQRPTTRVDLRQIAASATQRLAPMAEALGVEIRLEGDAAPPPVLGDGEQLLQVLTNLVENAVKYGLPGKEVSVRLRMVDKDPTLLRPAIVVDVVDQGEGIDPIHIPRLTERFYRVDTHRSREKGGTGLGLAIVKHILHRHRGRLDIASTRGQGSRFSIILPVD
ncbi:two-component sensor histidine kinase [Aliigemmobacter aestuarii]|uniref:histidine kinase n=1 Tax=Aliigemmobacter aestuarii TaxID=1445661 RepID=A0A4S3MLB0_9RHOB|nr:ATP-binding protein [Gemmobacter aestuarii]THD82946.1 two-component sensor histidine kinase [Gemmobacter aestuarii]